MGGIRYDNIWSVTRPPPFAITIAHDSRSTPWDRFVVCSNERISARAGSGKPCVRGESGVDKAGIEAPHRVYEEFLPCVSRTVGAGCTSVFTDVPRLKLIARPTWQGNRSLGSTSRTSVS